MKIKTERRVYRDHEEYALIEQDSDGAVLRVETFLTIWGLRQARARWISNENEEYERTLNE